MRKILAGEPGESLVWFLITHWLLGAFAGALCASIVLIVNVGQLRTLLAASDVLGVGLALLYGGFMLTFAAVVCGTALMQMASKA